MNIENEIAKLLTDFEKYHSEFQIDNFIVGKSGDDWARYKQALLEISNRQKSLINMREQLELDAYQLTIFKRIKLFFQPRRAREIYFAKRRRNRQEMVKEIAEIERELNRFVELAKALKSKLGDLTPDRRRQLEANSWLNKARQLIIVDSIVNGGRPSAITVEFIMGLPMKMQAEILNSYDSRKTLDNRRDFDILLNR